MLWNQLATWEIIGILPQATYETCKNVEQQRMRTNKARLINLKLITFQQWNVLSIMWLSYPTKTYVIYLVDHKLLLLYVQFPTRCRGYSQMRVKTRRDRGGLEPKSKRGWRKTENRLRRTEDHTGTRPYNTENAYGQRHRQTQQTNIFLWMQANNRSKYYNPRWGTD